MRALLAGLACLAWSLAGGLAATAQPQPPQGSYASRCEDAVMRGSQLRATCRTPTGAPRESMIDVLACRGRDIRVDEHGVLVCPGGDPASVILYGGTVWRGEWRAIRGDVADLARIGMNDRVRSIEMPVGAGEWEICTGIRFGGRCETVSTSVPDTGALGLANDVSSIRRRP